MFVVWYLGMNISKGQIPLVHDISSGINTFNSFGFSNLAFLAYFSVLLYLSPILSGTLLLTKKKAGIIISYIQVPFRLLQLIPPSIFFILWPLNSSMNKTIIIVLGILLTIFSEIIKILSLIYWNNKAHNQAFELTNTTGGNSYH